MVSRSRGNQKKIHALDTNVFMHDPAALFRFQEHDVFVPMTVLEELDNQKSGTGEAQRNARTASRFLRTLIEAFNKKGGDLSGGVPLVLHEQGVQATGKLYFELAASAPSSDVSHLLEEKFRFGLDLSVPDNRILAAVKTLEKGYEKAKGAAKRRVVFVTKDNNAYIKAVAVGIHAEDYLTDSVEEDGFDVGVVELDKMPDVVTCEKVGSLARYVVKDDERLRSGGCMIVKHEGGKPFRAFVGKRSRGRVELREAPSYFNGTKVYGINAHSEEQNFAFAGLMNPDVSAVILSGPAGTGKTLAALAAGIEQVIESKLYSEIIVTRVTVPMGEDIGFLPGSEEEKMGAWMGAFDDNLEVLVENARENSEWTKAGSKDMLRNIIKIKSMSFMRGRTFQQKFLIVDEAQNLTAKQIKALMTRVGRGSKIVLLGNLAQIDTPYLTASTSGLAYIAERVHATAPTCIAHVGLIKGERHELTDWVNENC